MFAIEEEVLIRPPEFPLETFIILHVLKENTFIFAPSTKPPF